MEKMDSKFLFCFSKRKSNIAKRLLSAAVLATVYGGGSMLPEYVLNLQAVRSFALPGVVEAATAPKNGDCITLSTAGTYTYSSANVSQFMFWGIDAGVTAIMQGGTFSGGPKDCNRGGFADVKGVLTIQGTTVVQNYSNAKDAGAAIVIYDTGVVNLSGTSITFQNNKLRGASQYGHDFYNDGGTVNITSGTVQIKDGFDMSGGAVNVTGGNTTINSLNVSGGHFKVSSATLKLSGGTMKSMSSDQGGAIYSAGSTTTISGITVYGNTSTSYGSAISLAEVSTMTISGSTIHGNSTSGGPESNAAIVLYNKGYNLTLSGTNKFYNNTANGSKWDIAAHKSTGTNTITISSGTTYLNGGLVVANENDSALSINVSGTLHSKTLDLKKATTLTVNSGGNVDNNYYATSGSGASMTLTTTVSGQGSFVMSNGTVNVKSGGSATLSNLNVAGGTILNAGSLTLKNGTLKDMTNNNGGAINSSGTLNVNGVTIKNNTATNEGGAITHNSGTTNITSSTFSGNKSTNSWGGAIALIKGNMTIKDSVFTGNISGESASGSSGSGTIVCYNGDGFNLTMSGTNKMYSNTTVWDIVAWTSNGASSITFASGGTTYLNNGIHFYNSGTGTLTTTVAGTLHSGNLKIGSSAVNFTVNNGGVLDNDKYKNLGSTPAVDTAGNFTMTAGTFKVNSGGKATLKNISITGGTLSNAGTLNLYTGTLGKAVTNTGTLELHSTTVSANITNTDGKGVVKVADGEVVLAKNYIVQADYIQSSAGTAKVTYGSKLQLSRTADGTTDLFTTGTGAISITKGDSDTYTLHEMSDASAVFMQLSGTGISTLDGGSGLTFTGTSNLSAKVFGIASGATLNMSNTLTFSGVTVKDGGAVINNAGTINITGTETFTGNKAGSTARDIYNSGILNIKDNNSVATAVSMNGGIVGSSGTLNIGDGTKTKDSTLTLTGAASISGQTTISVKADGILDMSASSGSLSGANSFSNAGTFKMGSGTLSSAVTNTSAVELNGTTVNANITDTSTVGTVKVKSGTVNVNSANTIQAKALQVENGGTLNIDVKSLNLTRVGTDNGLNQIHMFEGGKVNLSASVATTLTAKKGGGSNDCGFLGVEGTATVDNDSTITFQGGQTTLASGTGSMAGAVRVYSVGQYTTKGTVNYTNAVSISGGAAVYNIGTLNIQGSSTFTGSNYADIYNAGTANLTGDVSMTKGITGSDGTLNIGDGDVTAKNTVTLLGTDGIVGQTTITVKVDGNLSVNGTGVISGATTFNNAGVVNISADGLQNAVTNSISTDKGTVKLGAGTLGDYTITGGTIVVDGNVTANVVNLASTEGISVSDGKTLTLTGTTTLLDGISGNNGTTVIDGTITNTNNKNIVQKALTINSSRSLTTEVDKLNITDGTITNNGTLTLTADGSESDVLTESITNTNGVISFDAGTDKAITVSGQISGGTVNVTSGLMKYTNANAIGAKTVIKSGARLDPAANLLNADTTVESGGELYISSGTLGVDIKGAGTTYIKDLENPGTAQTITVNSDRSIAGTLNGSGNTVDMTGDTAFKTLSIGTLAGTTNLKIDVDMSTLTSDNLNISTTGNGASVNLSDIVVTKDLIATAVKSDGDLTIADGNITYSVSAGIAPTYTLSGGSIVATAADGYTYTFSGGSTPGTLTYTAAVSGLTLKKFVDGTLSSTAAADPSLLTLTGNLSNSDSNMTIGEATQSNSELTIDLATYNIVSSSASVIAIADGKKLTVNGVSGSSMDSNSCFSIAEGGMLKIDGSVLLMGSIENNSGDGGSTYGLQLSGNVQTSGAVNGGGSLKIDGGTLTAKAAIALSKGIILTQTTDKLVISANDLDSDVTNAGTVELNGTGTQTMTNIITGGTVKLLADVSAIGDKLVDGVSNNMFLNLAGKTLTITDGNLTVQVGSSDVTTGTLQIGSAAITNASKAIYAKIDNDGTLTVAANNVLNTVANSGILKLNGNELANGKTITGGSIEIIGNIEANANDLASVNGISNNTVSQTLTLNGGVLQDNITGEGATIISGTVTNGNNKTITQKALTINSAASLTTEADKLVIDSAIINNGVLTLTADGTAPDTLEEGVGIDDGNTTSVINFNGNITVATGKTIQAGSAINVAAGKTLTVDAAGVLSDVTNVDGATYGTVKLENAGASSATLGKKITGGAIVADGDVTTDVANLASTKGISVSDGKTMTLTGTTALLDSISGSNGTTVIDGTITNTNNKVIAQNTIIINSTASLTTEVDKLVIGSAIVNNGDLTLTADGTTDILTQNITKDVTDGTASTIAISNSMSVAAGKSIEAGGSITVADNMTLSIDAAGIKSKITANGIGTIVSLRAGALGVAIDGTGKITAVGNVEAKAGDLQATGGVTDIGSYNLTLTGGTAGATPIYETLGTDIKATNGKTVIGKSDVVAYVDGNSKKIKNAVEISSGSYFKAVIGDLDGTVTNHGTFSMSGDLVKSIAGTGTTVLQSDIVKGNAVGINIAGTLDGNSKTVDMQDSPVTYNTITVGTLAGTTNLKIDVDMYALVNDKLAVGAISGATVNLTDINITKNIDLSGKELGKEYDNAIVYVVDDDGISAVSGGGTYNVNSGSSVTVTNDFKYTFSKGTTDGTLKFKVEGIDLTFKKFVEGTLENYDVDPVVLSLTADLANTGTGSNAITMGLDSQSNSTININLNGHNLTSAVNPTTITVNSGKTINLNGGADSAGSIDANTNLVVDGNIAISGKTVINGTITNNAADGVVVADTLIVKNTISGTGSLKINGGTLTAEKSITQTEGITLAGSTDKLIIDAANLQSEVTNAGTVELGGSTAADATLGNYTISGEGFVVTKSSVTAGVANLQVTGGISNDGADYILTLNGDGTLLSDIVGAGTTKIDNSADVTMTSGKKISQANLTVENGSLTIDTDDLNIATNAGTIVNKGTLVLTADGTLEENVSGTGTLILNGNVVVKTGSTIQADTAINVAAGKTLTVDAVGVLSDVTNVDGATYGTVKLENAGAGSATLGKKITGGAIVVDGDVTTDVANLASTKGISVSDGKTMTLTGTTALLDSISGSNGTTVIDGTITNTNNKTITQKALTINSTASLTTEADKLVIDSAITNNGVLTLTADGTAPDTLEEGVGIDDGNTTSVINFNGNITVATGKTIQAGSAINVAAGKTLTVDAAGVLSDVTNVDGATYGTVKLENAGAGSATLGKKITGGAIVVDGDVTTDVGNLASTKGISVSDGKTMILTGTTALLDSISGSNGTTVIDGTITNANNKIITQKALIINSNRTLTTEADKLVIDNNGITNNGTLNLSDDKTTDDTLTESVGIDDGNTTSVINFNGNITVATGKTIQAGSAINVAAGKTLTVDAAGVLSDVTNVDGATYGTVKLENAGAGSATLGKKITGGAIVVDGDVTTDVANLASTKGISVSDGKTLTLTGGVLTKVVSGEGNIAIGDDSGVMQLVTTHADKIQNNGTLSVSDYGILTITGGVICKEIDNNGQVIINNSGSTVTVKEAISGDGDSTLKVMNATTFIYTGTAENSLGGHVQVVRTATFDPNASALAGPQDNNGNLVLNAGTLNVTVGSTDNTGHLYIAKETVEDSTTSGEVINNSTITQQNLTIAGDASIAIGAINTAGAGTFTTNLNSIKIKGGLGTSSSDEYSTITNNGKLIAIAGTLNNSLAGDGIFQIGNGGATVVDLAENVTVANQVDVQGNATLTVNANKLTSTADISNAGTLILTGGVLSSNVAGAGTTIIAENSIVKIADSKNFTQGATASEKQNLTINGTLDMTEEVTETYRELVVAGDMVSAGKIKIGVNLEGVSATDGTVTLTDTSCYDHLTVDGTVSGTLTLDAMVFKYDNETLEVGDKVYFQMISSTGANSITIASDIVGASGLYKYTVRDAKNVAGKGNGWIEIEKENGFTLGQIMRNETVGIAKAGNVSYYAFVEDYVANENLGTMQRDGTQLKTLTVVGNGFAYNGNNHKGVTVGSDLVLNLTDIQEIGNWNTFAVNNSGGTVNISCAGVDRIGITPGTTILSGKLQGAGTYNLLNGTLQVTDAANLAMTGENGLNNSGTVELVGGVLGAKVTGTGLLKIAGNVNANASYIAAETNTIDSDVTLTLTGGELAKVLTGDGNIVIGDGSASQLVILDADNIQNNGTFTVSNRGSLTLTGGMLAKSVVNNGVIYVDHADDIVMATGPITGTNGILRIEENTTFLYTNTVQNSLSCKVEIVEGATFDPNASSLAKSQENNGNLILNAGVLSVSVNGLGSVNTGHLYIAKENVGGNTTTGEVVNNSTITQQNLTIAGDAPIVIDSITTAGAGTFTTNLNSIKIKGGLGTSSSDEYSTITNNGKLIAIAGTLNNSLAGDGIFQIGNGGVTVVDLAENVTVANQVDVQGNATLTVNANKLISTADISNAGTLILTGGVLSSNVAGAGTSVIAENGVVKVSSDKNFIEGQNLTINGTLDMQGDSIAVENIAVGTLSGTGNIKIDVLIDGGSSLATDSISVGTGVSENTVLTLTGVNLSGDSTLSEWNVGDENSKTVALVTGSGLSNLTIGGTVTAVSGDYRYEFSQESAGSGLLKIVKGYGYTLNEIVSGTKGASVAPASVKTFVVISDTDMNNAEQNHFTNNGVSQDSLGKLHGNRELTISGNGKYLYGDATNAISEKNGITIAEGSTLNINNVREIAKFKDYAVDNSGTLNISGNIKVNSNIINNGSMTNSDTLDMMGTLAGNGTLNNSGTLNLLVSQNVKGTITGTGITQVGENVNLNISGSVAQSRITGDGVVKIAAGGTVNVPAGGLQLSQAVENAGTVKLTGDGALFRDVKITGTGTTNINGVVSARVAQIQQDIVINNKLTFAESGETKTINAVENYAITGSGILALDGRYSDVETVVDVVEYGDEYSIAGNTADKLDLTQLGLTMTGKPKVTVAKEKLLTKNGNEYVLKDDVLAEKIYGESGQLILDFGDETNEYRASNIKGLSNQLFTGNEKAILAVVGGKLIVDDETESGEAATEELAVYGTKNSAINTITLVNAQPTVIAISKQTGIEIKDIVAPVGDQLDKTLKVVDYTSGTQVDNIVAQEITTLNIIDNSNVGGLALEVGGTGTDATLDIFVGTEGSTEENKDVSVLTLVGDGTTGLVKNSAGNVVKVNATVYKDSVFNIGRKGQDVPIGNAGELKTLNTCGETNVYNSNLLVNKLEIKQGGNFWVDPSYVKITNELVVAGVVGVQSDGSVLNYGMDLTALKTALGLRGVDVTLDDNNIVSTRDQGVLALDGKADLTAEGAQMGIARSITELTESGKSFYQNGGVLVVSNPLPSDNKLGDALSSVIQLNNVGDISVTAGSKLIVHLDNVKHGQYYTIVWADKGDKIDLTTLWQQSDIFSTSKKYKMQIVNEASNCYVLQAKYNSVEDIFVQGVIATPKVFDVALQSDEVTSLGTFVEGLSERYAGDGATDATKLAGAKALNAVTNMSEMAAVQHGAVSMMNQMSSSLNESMGLMHRPIQNKKYDNQVWATYVQGKDMVDGMKLAGIDAKYDLKLNGTTVGADLWSSSKSVGGLAVTYSKGNVVSKDSYDTKNDSKYYGVSVYNRLDAGKNAVVLFDVGYMNSSNDIVQNNNNTRITADAKTNSITAGVRYEHLMKTGKSNVVPFAGMRYVRLQTRDYENSLGMKYEAKNQNLFLPQVGLNWNAKFGSKDGGYFKPMVEVGYIWTLGNRNTEQTVKFAGTPENFCYDTADSGSYYAKIAAEYVRSKLSFGVSYTYSKGDKVRNNKWNVNVSWSF